MLVTYILKWARIFLVRMIVDYDANNGEGRVIIERLLPHPTLPETVQFPLQQAAQGSPEVNTRGLLNTLIVQLKGLQWLRQFTIGDLTLRGPAAPFGITMYSIKDPAGVKAKLEADWKKIEGIKAKERAEKDRTEQIDRMTIAVTQGLVQGLSQLRQDNQPLPPVLPPPPAAPPDPGSLEWEPVWALRRAAPARPSASAPPSEAAQEQAEEEGELFQPEEPVPPSEAPLGATELTTSQAAPNGDAGNSPPPESSGPRPSTPASS